MDYYNHSCPVCKKQFDSESDTVVCPECGTPHHRECYEELGRCYFHSRHKDGFDYKTYYEESKAEETAKTDNSATAKCFICGTENMDGSKFCCSCGAPLGEGAHKAYDRHSEEGDAPYSAPKDNTQTPPQGMHTEHFAFDPLGGLNADEEVGDGVTVGEAAKFVKNNTPFYSRLFHQIKTRKKSQFTLAGFLFTGGWMLYRKMYKLGTIITLAMALLIGTQLFINTFYHELMTELSIVSSNIPMLTGKSTVSLMQDFLSTIDMEDIIVILIESFAEYAALAIQIICGIFGHRWHYKHCMRKIREIKDNASSKEEANAALQTKGGVNTALAFSLGICYFVLRMLPMFFLR